MFNFLKKSSKRPVEEWANFMNEKEFNLFIDLVEKNLSNLTASRDGAKIVFSNSNYWGLSNLALTCKQYPESEWENIVNDFFRRQLQVKQDSAKLKAIINDYAVVKEHIVTRVVSQQYLGALGKDALIYRIDIPETITSVMFDLGEVMESIKPEMLTIWNKSIDELIEEGKNNVIRKYKFEEFKQKAGDEIEFNTLAGRDLVTSTASLLFDNEYSKYQGTYGVIFAIPSNQYMISFPVSDLDVVVALNELIPLTKIMVEREPRPISDKLYWYFEGKYTLLPADVEKDTINFTPPEEFLAVLNKLKRPE